MEGLATAPEEHVVSGVRVYIKNWDGIYWATSKDLPDLVMLDPDKQHILNALPAAIQRLSG